MKAVSYNFGFLGAESGASLVELAFVTPLLLLILIGAADFGRAYYLAIEIAGAAHAGAEYGAENPTDSTGIVNAAKYDAPDVANLTVATPIYGCECADGSSFSTNCTVTPSCTSTNVVYRVTVKVSATYRSFIPWPKIPSQISLSNSATMRSGGI